MTDLSAEQNAMLERLAKKHGLGYEYTCDGFATDKNALAALRELLLAVQETDAMIAQHCFPYEATMDVCEAIRAETYADLFLKEE